MTAITPMQRILKYARRLETAVNMGGCPIDKLFMADKLSWSDIYIVPMGEEFDKTLIDSDHTHKLRVEVVMRRARDAYESKWRWAPEHFDHGMLIFYHTDFNKLLELAADYLEQHTDPDVDNYVAWEGSKQRRATVIKCLKHQPIGRLVHISDDPDYDNYKLN